MSVTDDGIRERHGVDCRDASNNLECVVIGECGEYVRIDRAIGERFLTEWQARYLAAKLYRLARRIRARKGGEQ